MLVIAPNLVLSDADEAFGDGVPLILWDSLVTVANIAADTEELDYPATNLANPSTIDLQGWRAEDTTEQYVTASLNTMVEVDGVGLAGHNLGSAGIAVSVEIDIGAGFVEVIAPFIPADDSPILMVFTGASLVDLRLKLAEGDEPARIAVMYAGKLLRVERGFDVGQDFTPPKFARKTEALNGMSHRGQFIGRIITSQWVEGSSATFKHFHPDWYRTYFDPFVVAAQRDVPFFFAWSPEDYPYEVAFAWLTKDPVPAVSMVTGRNAVTIEMGGIVE